MEVIYMLVAVKELKKLTDGKQVPWIEDLIKGKRDDAEIDIINRKDYVASKLWCREDIKNILIEEGYEGLEEQVDIVVNSGELSGLNDCTDEDWEIIRIAIKNAFASREDKGSKIKRIRKSLKTEITDFSTEALVKQVRKQFSEDCQNAFGEPLAYIALETGETLEIISEQFSEQFSCLIYDECGNPQRQYYHADTLEELLKTVKEVCDK